MEEAAPRRLCGGKGGYIHVKGNSATGGRTKCAQAQVEKNRQAALQLTINSNFILKVQ